MGYIENCFFGFYNVKNNRCAVSLCSRYNRLVQLTKYCENGKKIFILFYFKYSFSNTGFCKTGIHYALVIFFELVPICDISVKT